MESPLFNALSRGALGITGRIMHARALMYGLEWQDRAVFGRAGEGDRRGRPLGGLGWGRTAGRVVLPSLPFVLRNLVFDSLYF